MMQVCKLSVLVMGAVALAACGEKPQTAGTGKNDVAAYQGAQNSFVAKGWQPGDKTSWEQSLKARGQNSQNEYNKMK